MKYTLKFDEKVIKIQQTVDEFLILQRNMKSEIILRGFLHSIMVKIADAFAGKFFVFHNTISFSISLYFNAC